MAKQPAKATAKTEKKPEPKKAVVLTPLLPEVFAKRIFIGVSVFIVLLMAYLSKDYGITGDENFHRVYGHHVLHFYTSFGEDKTATLPYGNPDSLMMYYGGFYDGTAAALSEAMPGVDEWRIRHFWNSLFASAAMILAGLVAVEIAGWQAGLIVLLFMFLSPRFFGEGMNNPKDITMATGYVLSYLFILRFIKQLPKPRLSVAIGLGVAIGIALGIRIGGLLLIPYFIMFYGLALWQLYGFKTLFDFSQFKEKIWPSFKYTLLACVLGFAIGMFFWPYGLISPIDHTLETLGVSEKFPAQIRMLFDGEMIFSTEIPWYYIPKWIYITAPLFALLGLVASLLIVPAYFKQGKIILLGFIFFTLVFPVFYIIYKKAVLYDGMRHLYFVYPSIVILAGLAFDYFIQSQQKTVKYVVAGVALLLMLLPARFMLANHPNQAVYFNELIGGMKGSFGKYESDYYMNSVKQCADWLRKNEPLKKRNGEKILIRSNAVAPCNFYFKPDSADVNVGYTSYRNRGNEDADYLILYNRFVDRDLLVNGCFPPEQSIHTVYVDGVPLSCVIKREDKGDYLAAKLMEQNDYAGAIALLEPYTQQYQKNETALANLGMCYLNVQRLDDAARVLTQSLSLNKQNTNAGYWLGLAYFYKQDFSGAASILTNVVKENPYFPPPYRILSECMMRLGDRNAAEYYANIYRQLGGGR